MVRKRDLFLTKEHDPIKGTHKAGENKAMLGITKGISTTKGEYFRPGQQERCIRGKILPIKAYKNISAFDRRRPEKST